MGTLFYKKNNIVKLLLNIWYENLHRKVFDKVHLHDSDRHHGNKLTNRDLKNEALYNRLEPYFKGWRMSIGVNLWWVKKYHRYEYRKLDFTRYEYNQLSLWNKTVYTARKWFNSKKPFERLTSVKRIRIVIER